jgi:hypothetical protein
LPTLYTHAVNDRDQRLARNETILRAANREIEHASAELGEGSDSEIEVLCECGRARCNGLLTLAMREFEEAHAEADRFIVAPGHEDPEIERVVEDRGTYLVVDKFGEAEDVAEASEA